VNVSKNQKNTEIISSMIHATRSEIDEILRMDHIIQPAANESTFEAENRE
jgi:hypothetical protein